MQDLRDNECIPTRLTGPRWIEVGGEWTRSRYQRWLSLRPPTEPFEVTKVTTRATHPSHSLALIEKVGIYDLEWVTGPVEW